MQQACTRAVADTMEDRLENWSRVVRSPRFQSGECAFWAKIYCSLRDAEKAPDGPTMSKDERDGWLIEKAWSMLPDHVYKWTLKYTHIWRMSPEQIQARMRKVHGTNIRGRKLEVILADAHAALRRNIAAVTTAEAMENMRKTTCIPLASKV